MIHATSGEDSLSRVPGGHATFVAVPKPSGQPAGECPSEDDLLALIAGQLDADPAQAIRDHIDGCPSCAAAVGVLLREATPMDALPSRRLRERGDRIGRYRVERVLGRGNMGTVYLAHDERLARDVAIKLLHDASHAAGDRARMRAESRALARVSSEHVTPVFDVDVDGRQTFIAMEYVRGDNLRVWLRTERTAAEITAVFAQAARGLAAAHAAGLVHRDFKPENVLVGRDGRVRVTDFGLASTGTADAPVSDAGALDDVDLGGTQSGGTSRLVGTPAYLAPELWRGGPATARSDQFAFFVALYEALWQQRPFAGDGVDSLRSAVCAGDLRAPPARRPTVRHELVARWLARMIVRGLTREPAERFADMASVATGLEHRTPGRSRVLVALAPVPVLAAFAFAIGLRDHADPCRDRGSPDAAWQHARPEVIEHMSQVAPAFGATTAERVAARLDATAAVLRERAAEACAEARTQQGGEVTARLVCIDERAAELAAMVRSLQTADAVAVAEATRAVDGWAAHDPCDEIAAPTELLAEVAAIRTRLAESAALRVLERRDEAASVAEAAAAEAHRLGWPPLEAEATLARALAIDRGIDPRRAADTMFDAAWSAEAAGDDHTAARALVELVMMVGYDLSDVRRAREIARQAEVAIARGGGDEELELLLRTNIAHIDYEAGDLEHARTLLADVIRAHEARTDDDLLARAEALHILATVTRAQADYAGSVELALRSAELVTRTVGPLHPRLGPPLTGIVIAAIMRARSAEAIAWAQHVLVIHLASYGPDHISTATSRTLLSVAFEQLGALAAAEGMVAEAVATYRRLHAESHPEYPRVLASWAGTLSANERHADAERVYLEVLEATAARRGKDNVEYASYLYAYGDEQRLAGEMVRAEQTLREARAIMRGQMAEDHPDVLRIEAILAAVLIDGQRHDEAIALLEPALAHIAAHDEPELRARIQVDLGQALVESGRDRERGRALVLDALAFMRIHDEATAAAIVAWLDER